MSQPLYVLIKDALFFKFFESNESFDTICFITEPESMLYEELKHSPFLVGSFCYMKPHFVLSLLCAFYSAALEE